MLAEYLSDAQWQSAAPGISMCTISQWTGSGEVPLQMKNHHLEIFFCQGGSLLLQRCAGAAERIRSNAVALFSDCSGLSGLCQEQPLDGVCLCIDCAAAASDFETASRSLHLALQAKQVEELLEHHDGVVHVPNTVWNRTMSATMKLIPPSEQSRYCVLKSLELVYLLCTRNKMLETTAALSPNWRGLSRTIRSMRHYMETHLDEKLTIATMSRQFQISPTAFKSGFRSLYGQPVHNWLLEKRLETSTRLLLSSSMTVLQIAQEVGYESVGQFNVVFRRQYGVTPSQYRKMSHSKKI